MNVRGHHSPGDDPRPDVPSRAGPWEYVFLARHGRTEWNEQGRRQGQLDSPLTAAGIAQARRHARTLRGEAIDRVFTSPLGRAAATADIIADAVGAPVSIIDDLAEVHHGLFAGLSNEDIEARFPGELDRRARDKYRWRFPGGESYADADRRALRALASMAKIPTRRPLLVSHEMIGRMLQRHLLGLEPEVALAYGHPHDVIYVIDPRARTRRELRPAPQA